jgi:hypothetical protein
MWFRHRANMDQRERVYIRTMTTKGQWHRGLPQLLHQLPPPMTPTAPSEPWTAPVEVSSSAPTSAPIERLEFAVKGILVGYENNASAESRIGLPHGRREGDFVI